MGNKPPPPKWFLVTFTLIALWLLGFYLAAKIIEYINA